jgi:hypothetical protein
VRWPDRSILLKLDCEGYEGPILSALAACGWLAHVQGIILEWHRQAGAPGSEFQVMNGLREAGFTVYAQALRNPSQPTGLAVAFRMREGQRLA